MTNTHTHITGDKIYDFLMSKIEPELVTAELPKLQERFGSEDEDARKVRAARYEAAFAEYDRQYLAFMAGCKANVRKKKKQAMKSTEQEHRAIEQEQLSAIESAFSDT